MNVVIIIITHIIIIYYCIKGQRRMFVHTCPPLAPASMPRPRVQPCRWTGRPRSVHCSHTPSWTENGLNKGDGERTVTLQKGYMILRLSVINLLWLSLTTPGKKNVEMFLTYFAISLPRTCTLLRQLQKGCTEASASVSLQITHRKRTMASTTYKWY